MALLLMAEAGVAVRPRVLMICAHEPGLDPRIRWEAEGADGFDVTVLGFNRPDAPLPADERLGSYRVVRLPHRPISGARYLWQLKGVVPSSLFLPLAVLLVVALPLLAAAELGGRILRSGFHRASRVPSLANPLRVGRGSGLIDWLRSRLLMRLEYIVTALRGQFAPAAATFWAWLRDTKTPPDVVHCNDLDTLLVGVLAKQRFGCRLVYDAHEFYPVSDPRGRWLDIAFFTWVERLLIRHADAVVTVNPPLGEAMRATYGLGRVYAVPNAEPWVEESLGGAVIGSDLDRLAKGRVKFLFQGRFAAGRGIEELIEEWAAVDGSRAALFLRGPETIWRDAAMALAAEKGLLGTSIFFLDAVGEDELVAAASAADIGVIPYKPLIINDRLSCPNKLSQYLHAGLAVLANDLPYVRSVLTEAQAGAFYSTAMPGSLAKTVNGLLDNPDWLPEARRNALCFAHEHFNWQAQSAILYTLYRGEVEQPQPAASSITPSERSAPPPALAVAIKQG